MPFAGGKMLMLLGNSAVSKEDRRVVRSLGSEVSMIIVVQLNLAIPMVRNVEQRKKFKVALAQIWSNSGISPFQWKIILATLDVCIH
jgi:hypothetical protein